MAPKILDSHIHLWPSTATTAKDHGWMKPGVSLAKQYGIQEYDHATSSASVAPAGFVYVETDRYLPASTPDTRPGDADAKAKIREWARAPLQELEFLRRVVEGAVWDGDGARQEDGERMRGMVVWAPFHLPKELFEIYMRLAWETLGDLAGRRVVGFRYLLQGRTAQEVESITGNEWFVGNVKGACEQGARRLAFDVGVDAHRDGVETLGAVARLIQEVGQGVPFVLNHLCKPDLSEKDWEGFERWQTSVDRVSSHPNVFMKFSGALNEFSPSTTPSSADEVLSALRPYLEHVFQRFEVQRIMFGSDWPVCNVGGPKGESGNWGYWVEVVAKWLEEKKLSEGQKAWIWAKSAATAYAIGEF